MAEFSGESLGQFEVPGVQIEPTLSNIYDPYSGINMTIQDSCSHVEVMTLPLGVVSEVEEVICNDPFATNGPIEYGGNGQPGRCYNSGTINCRYVGSHNNSLSLELQIHFGQHFYSLVPSRLFHCQLTLCCFVVG